jgi:polyisoprenoid-binding protein YceI
MTAASTVSTGVWNLDAGQSSASFTAHQLWLDVPGVVPFRAGRAEIGPGGELLGATAELDLAAIDTGNPRRERDLAKRGLLDLVTHPTLSVEVGPGTRTPGGWTAWATVGARGATSQIEVQVTVGERGTDGRLHVTVSGVLDRKPLGMRVPRFAIGRWVHIEVSAVFAPQ